MDQKSDMRPMFVYIYSFLIKNRSVSMWFDFNRCMFCLANCVDSNVFRNWFNPFCVIFSANSIYSDYLLIALKRKEKKKLFPNQSTNTNKSHLKQLYHHLLTTSTDSFVTHKKNFFRHVFQILFHFCANKFFPHTFQPNTQLTQLKVHFHYMTC